MCLKEDAEMEMQKKLLIVDDEQEMRNMLKEYLVLKGYLVYMAKDGQETMESLAVQPDLILLDVNMPMMDGIEVCRRIRGRVSCPILFLTARVEEQDRINGLLSGGDDYILKPFSLRELEARIVSHIRREERQMQNVKLAYHNGLWIDYIGRCVQYDGEHGNQFYKTQHNMIK
jgi:DNA-binding response OmpR family regulator